jgi:FixJ family two-component response regulator
LVTDVIMPQMGGDQLARQLAGDRPAMKVLYLSGYSEKTVFQQGMLGRGTAFLQKPFAAQALLGKVREMLDATVELDKVTR